MPIELKMSPQELVNELKAIYDALDQNGQAAGGLFGLIYADHLAANSRDRSPNSIARRARSHLWSRRQHWFLDRSVCARKAAEQLLLNDRVGGPKAFDQGRC